MPISRRLRLRELSQSEARFEPFDDTPVADAAIHAPRETMRDIVAQYVRAALPELRRPSPSRPEDTLGDDSWEDWDPEEVGMLTDHQILVMAEDEVALDEEEATYWPAEATLDADAPAPLPGSPVDELVSSSPLGNEAPEDKPTQQ